jgi:hypothetical protein
MATMTADRLVEDYLQRLEATARHLPADRRAELVLEIREHIDHALSETGTEDELAVRNALERLGPPEDIVAAAEPAPAPAPRADAPARRPWLEIAAVIALLIPLAGWVVGFVLVALSRIWSNREKAIALALIVAAIVLPALGVMSSSGGVEEPVPVREPVEPPTSDSAGPGPSEFFLLVLGGLPAAVFLAWRLSMRRSTV